MYNFNLKQFTGQYTRTEEARLQTTEQLHTAQPTSTTVQHGDAYMYKKKSQTLRYFAVFHYY